MAGRQGNQRIWQLMADFLPAGTSEEELEAVAMTRRSLPHALRALGVATVRQIKAHFTRNDYPGLTAVLAEMIAANEVVTVQVTGDDGALWPGTWYMLAEMLPIIESLQQGMWQPRTSLLSPFDNLICDRKRTELMWDFRFRIEIYVPAAKRQYGYYVLPILHGQKLVGRVAPRMNRKTGVLQINGVYAEPGWDERAEVGVAVATAVANLADFLGATEIKYERDKVATGWRAYCN